VNEAFICEAVRTPIGRYGGALAKLKTPLRNPGTVTAGNAAGINAGAAAMIVASEAAFKRHGLTPRARVLGMATAAVPSRIMGIGPVPVVQKLLARLRLKIGNFAVIEREQIEGRMWCKRAPIGHPVDRGGVSEHNEADRGKGQCATDA
jgi:acetyl-CoA acetyltransferase